MKALRCSGSFVASSARERQRETPQPRPRPRPAASRAGPVRSSNLRAPSLLGNILPLLQQSTPRSSTRTNAASAVQWFAGLKKDAIRILFNLPYRCSFGENLAIVGSGEPLGAWDPDRSVPLTWSEGDVWQGEIEMDSSGPEKKLFYKYVVRGADGTVVNWKPGDDICLELPGEDAYTVVVADAWDGKSQTVEVVSRPEVEKETELMAQEAAERSLEEANQQQEAEKVEKEEKDQVEVEIEEVREAKDECEPEPTVAEATASPPSEVEHEVQAVPEATVSPPSEVQEEVQAPPPIGKVAEEVRRMADAADGLSASLTDCLISAADESDIEECLVVASDSLPQGKGQQAPSRVGAQVAQMSRGSRADVPRLAEMLEGMYDPDIAAYIVEGVADQALADLDDALTVSIEMQHNSNIDPTAPEVLAADRLVAAAAKRAVDMTRALEATRSAAMLTGDKSGEFPEELEFPSDDDIPL